MVSAFCPPRLCFSMRIPTNRATTSHSPTTTMLSMPSISPLRRPLNCAGLDSIQSPATIEAWSAVGNLTARLT